MKQESKLLKQVDYQREASKSISSIPKAIFFFPLNNVKDVGFLWPCIVATEGHNPQEFEVFITFNSLYHSIPSTSASLKLSVQNYKDDRHCFICLKTPTFSQIPTDTLSLVF